MTANELRRILDDLDMSQRDLARELGAGYRTVQSWALGEVDVPGPVARILTVWARRPEVYESGLHERRDEVPAAGGRR